MSDRLLVWLWKNWRPLALWSAWLALAVGAGLYFAGALTGRNQGLFLPGQSSDGHYQIEPACDACHTPLEGAKQEACMKCHGEELAKAGDSHAMKKFKDPHNAPLLEKLDASSCIVCHGEHQREHTRPAGVTQPLDFCIVCHEEVGKDRPSHRDLPIDGCSACHNYHDNRALYEDFLAKHLDEADTRTVGKALVPGRNLLAFYKEKATHPVVPLTLAHADAPDRADSALAKDWEDSSHARAGVNCLACHSKPERPEWTAKPDHSFCAGCHRNEISGFLKGRHGMRIARGLAPLHPDDARLPMQDNAPAPRACNTCHKAHQYATVPESAAVSACLDCHADRHSLAYRSSPHNRLVQEAQAGRLDANAAVTCATCHLPRETARKKGKIQVKVQHNQSDNLRPNQKMVRDVCLACHGLGFSLDALADRDLIQRNFAGKPAIHLKSLEMTEQRTATHNDDQPKRRDSDENEP